MRFSIVDVFTNEPLGGNPLAVVADADALDERRMRRIAGEFNQSETTFVLAPTEAGADVRLRSFTATGTEVSAIGHNGLGAWWWLAETGRLPPRASGVYHQQIDGGVLAVEVRSKGGALESIVAAQAAPSFRASIDDAAALARALALDPDDLRVGTLRPRVVWTGAPHLMVPVRTRAAVDRANAAGPALRDVLRAVDGEGCYVFSTEPGDPAADAYARFFNPTAGIVEDPATGSAAGPLACYLVENGLGAPGALFVEQGHRMGRPSRIEVRVAGDAVAIFGSCVTVAEGELRV